MTYKESESKYYIGTTKANDLFEYPPTKGVVRGEVIFGGYVIEKIDDKKTRVTYVSCTDLNGSIPQMLVNQVQQSQGSIAGRVEVNMKGKQWSSNIKFLIALTH